VIAGYKMGNLNVPCSKQQPYDTDLRVPLSWAGPGIKPGTILKTPSSNVDFLPTWLDLAGIPIPSVVDGKSLAPLLVTEPNSVYEPRSEAEQASVKAGWRTAIIAEYLR
jgi:extracellular sulfatase Sulf